MLKSISIAALLAAAPAVVAAQPGTPAASRIEAYNQAVIGVMKEGPKLGLKGREARFEPIVSQFYAMPTIAQIAAGAGWATASPADRQALVTAMTKHSAASLASNFDRYGGEKFTVNPQVKQRGADQLVASTITPPSGDATTLIYRMRDIGGQPKIIDVIAEGVSQLALQRADFATTVASGGVPALVRKLAAIDAKMLSGS